MAPGSSSAVDLAQVVEALGTPGFSRALHEYLRKGVSAKLLFAYAIRPEDDGAIHLMTETLSARMRSRAKDAARTYAGTDFRTDKTLREVRQEKSPGPTVRLHHVEDFEDRDFRERYFERFGNREEIAVFDGEGPELLYIGLCAEHFSDEEQDFVRQQASLILALMQKHRQIVEATAANAERPSEFEQIHAMLMEHPCGLTSREAEICVLVAKGYSSEAIALNLNISQHTVATHRKRAYAKLRVSSKAELFAQIYVPSSTPYGIVG